MSCITSGRTSVAEGGLGLQLIPRKPMPSLKQKKSKKAQTENRGQMGTTAQQHSSLEAEQGYGSISGSASQCWKMQSVSTPGGAKILKEKKYF